MEIDIYGDLDNLDNQFEVVQKENEELKETVQKLEETSIKFSIEVNELKRINSNLELNISSLFKTAKAELDRKNTQIAELRKELDNVLFKRGTTKKIPDKGDENSQEKQNLSTQFEKAQYDLDQRNKIIQSLTTELDNMRKELNEKGNILKRNASQIEEENENRFKAKIPKLDKDTFVENEEDYKNYRNRNERSENYGSRANSPNIRNSGHDDLRSKINLKKINYQRRHSREDSIPNNQRYNRQNYRNPRFTGKYTDYSKKYYRCNNNEERERQNYLSEHNKYDSGVLNFQMPEYPCKQENIPKVGFSASSTFSYKNIENELEEGELDKTNFSDFKSHRVLERSLQEQSRHDNRKYTVTNISCTESDSSSNKNEKSVSEILHNIWESKPPKNEKKSCSSTVVSEPNTEKITDKNKSKLDEMKKENISCTDSEKVEENVSKTKNEKIKTRKENIEDIPKYNVDAVKESAIVEDSKIVPEKKVKTSKTESKKEKINSELKLHKDKKEKSKSIKSKSIKSKSIKSKSEKSDSGVSTDLKSTKEKLPAEKKSKSAKPEAKSKQEKEIKSIESNSKTVSETKSSDIKIEKTNSEPKDTNIKLVTEATSNTTKKEKLSETKSVAKNTPAVENNMPIISLPIVDENSNKNKSDKFKSKPNTSTNEKVDENISELQSAAIFNISEKFPADSKIPEIKESGGKQNESDVSNLETTKPTVINVDESSTNIQKIETTTQPTDRKPPITGRRRRCVISIK